MCPSPLVAPIPGLPGPLTHVVGNMARPTVGNVQVGHGCALTGVPHALHQLTKGCAGLRRERVPGVPQVVEVHRRHAGLGLSRCAVRRRRCLRLGELTKGRACGTQGLLCAGHDFKSAVRTCALLPQLRLWPEPAVVIVPIGPRNNSDVRSLLHRDDPAIYPHYLRKYQVRRQPVVRTGPSWQDSTEDVNQLWCRQIQHLISERCPRFFGGHGRSLCPRPPGRSPHLVVVDDHRSVKVLDAPMPVALAQPVNH